MYEKLPGSLKTELLVRTVEGDVDEKTLAQRQELTRSMSPAQLGQIHGLSDFPVPQLFGGKKDQDKKERK